MLNILVIGSIPIMTAYTYSLSALERVDRTSGIFLSSTRITSEGFVDTILSTNL